MKLLEKTKSLCPECLTELDATIYAKNNKVLIDKECKKHGKYSDTYFGDYKFYEKAKSFAHDGKGIENPNIKDKNPLCPKACGLCNIHKTHTALGNIVLTNRCDLTCFYCFFYAKAMGYVYEPTLDQIRLMLRSMRAEKPVAANAVQLTGGEPTMREDLIEIIKIAEEEGYDHIQLNTNGIRLAHEQELASKVRKAGVNTVYMSFDGTTPKTNPKNHYEVPYALENCRKAGMGVVLVPTVINTVNDHDVGNILKFGLKHIDVVRSVNYQPVSLVGRITRADVKKYRITIPDVIQKLAEQTGFVEKEDFYPIPTVSPLTHFIEALTNLPKYELTTHFACGAATYLFKDGNKIISLPRFVDVEGLLEFLEESAEEIRSGKSKIITSMKVLAKLNSFIDKEKQPSNLKLSKLLFNILAKGNYNALGDLQMKSFFVGMMAFMDLHNYDIERVKRCCIHYAVPDGRILPFCAFNVIPQWYRDKIQKEYGMSFKEWKAKSGKDIKDDLYRRDINKLMNSEIYRKTYEGFI